MTSDKAYDLICNVYATFGKSAPSRHAGVVDVITERIAPVPDRVATEILKKLQDLDSMPSNLGKAIMDVWETWKLENPRAMYKEACPMCGGYGGFEAYERPADGKIHHFFAFCPHCAQRREGFRYLTPKQWEALGVLCMPPDYEGGKLQFEYDYELVPKPAGGDGKIFRDLKALKLRMNRRTGYDRGYGMESA